MRQMQQQRSASLKDEKYVDLGARYVFETTAVETLDVFNASASSGVARL